MILFVSKVEKGEHALLELSDGWYCLKANIDAPIKRLINSGKIGLGQKLHIQGAQLSGANEACAVLEAFSRIQLKISVNSMRRAKWFETLGFQRVPYFPVCIGSIINDGGIITCVDIIICRKFPIFYVEKCVGGGTIFRTQQEENIERNKYQVFFFIIRIHIKLHSIMHQIYIKRIHLSLILIQTTKKAFKGV